MGDEGQAPLPFPFSMNSFVYSANNVVYPPFKPTLCCPCLFKVVIPLHHPHKYHVPLCQTFDLFCFAFCVLFVFVETGFLCLALSVLEFSL